MREGDFWHLSVLLKYITADRLSRNFQIAFVFVFTNKENQMQNNCL